jgi:DNA-binding GntR family transcriptional regulator
MDAVEQRDTDVAVHLLREHRDHALAALRRSLDDDIDPTTAATA